MPLKLHQIILPVKGIDQAENFYSQMLEIPGRRISSGRHQFDCGGTILTCYDAVAEGHSSAAEPHPHLMYFLTDDLDAAFERAKAPECTLLDKKILAQPWGGRSFRVKDPFGNFLGFLDQAALERQNEEQLTAGPENRITVGAVLAVQPSDGKSQKRLAGSVVKIFKEEIWLKVTQPAGDQAFQAGDGVQIQYWSDKLPYVSETKVVQVHPADVNQFVAVGIPTAATQLQRRTAPRVPIHLPLSLSVLKSAKKELKDQAFESETADLSVGGLRFITEHPVQRDDELKVDFTLPPSDKMSIPLRVVSTESVKREDKTLLSVGTKFLELNLDQQIKLLQFLIDFQEKQGGTAADAIAQTPEMEGSEASSAQTSSADQTPSA